MLRRDVAPWIDVDWTPRGNHRVRVRGDGVGKRGGRPKGAVCVQLYANVGERENLEARQARFIGAFTGAYIEVPGGVGPGRQGRNLLRPLDGPARRPGAVVESGMETHRGMNVMKRARARGILPARS